MPFRRLECQECHKHASYVSESCEGIDMEFCKKCMIEYLINVEYPSTIKRLEEKIQSLTLYIKCQKSKEGHNFVLSDRTQMLRFTTATIYHCSKCGLEKEEYPNLSEWKLNESWNVAQ